MSPVTSSAPAPPDRRMGPARMLAALVCLLGAAAIIASFFMTWFTVDTSARPAGIGELAEALGVSLSLDGFASFDVIEWAVIAFAALAAVCASVAMAGSSRVAASLGGSFGIAAAIVVAWRLLDPPGDDLIVEPGAWLALAGAFAVAAAGLGLSLSLPGPRSRPAGAPRAVAPGYRSGLE